MNNSKTKLFGYIAAALVVVGIVSAIIFSSNRSSSIVAGSVLSSTINAPAANVVLPNGTTTPNGTNFDYLISRVYAYFDGAVGFGNYTGVPTNIQTVRSALIAATSTPCNLQSPFSTATSTIWVASVNITKGTTTAVGDFEFATSTSMNSTTSPITGSEHIFAVVGPSSFSTGSVSTTTGFGVIIAPSGWLNWGSISTSSGVSNGAYTYVGSCEATFQTIN